MAQILYQKIADDIKKNILSGKYEVGTLIPTENDLEKQYEVSKITVRRAVEQLVAEGYLVKKSGIGTRVISNDLFNKLSKARSYSSIVNKQGKLSKEILEVKSVDAKNTPLGLDFANKNIVYIKRLYSLNDKPFIIVEHYLPNIKVPSKVSELQNQSLYTFLKDSGQEVSSFKDEFSAVSLSAEVRKLLEKDDNLGLKRIRRGYDNQGNLIEYTVSIYDSQKMPYEIEYEI